MASLRTLYWFLIGGMIGFGFIAILSIGFPFILLGAVLLVVGALRFGGTEAWATLIGFGAVPAAILIWDVTSGPWACYSLDGSIISGSSQPNVNYYSCVDTPFGPLTTYHVMAAGFVVLALVGVAALLFFGLRRQVHRPAGG
jgi:hypothetical protein